MQLNKYYLEGSTNAVKNNVTAHELGHCLGLDHSTSADLMDASIFYHTTVQSLSTNDKDSYDAAYKKY